MHCLPGLPQQLWQQLQMVDHGLSVLPEKGVGEFSGHQLRVHWARDAAQNFFAMQVIDPDGPAVLEVAGADTGQERALFVFKNILGESEPLNDLVTAALDTVAGADQEPVFLKNTPSFASLLTTFAGDGVPLVVEDRAYKKLIEDDLAYWQQLAKSQAKIIKKMEQASQLASSQNSSHVVGDFAAAVAPGQRPDKAARQWRLDEMQEWAALNQERIVILPRAIASARRSPYEKPEQVYQALELLAETYRLTKMGLMDRAKLKEHADKLNLNIGGSVEPSVAAKAGEQYFVRWNLKRRFLDQHLGRGQARDARFTMRIYYLWCEDSERVVVGWLPSHLDSGGS